MTMDVTLLCFACVVAFSSGGGAQGVRGVGPGGDRPHHSRTGHAASQDHQVRKRCGRRLCCGTTGSHRGCKFSKLRRLGRDEPSFAFFFFFGQQNPVQSCSRFRCPIRLHPGFGFHSSSARPTHHLVPTPYSMMSTTPPVLSPRLLLPCALLGRTTASRNGT